MLGGCVKTLYPVVHGGERSVQLSLSPSRSDIGPGDIPSDQQDLSAQIVAPIFIVVCNLSSAVDAVEEIDIGGVTLRAAAKNRACMSVFSWADPADHAKFVKACTEGKVDVGTALGSRLALKALEMTVTDMYDVISGYFREQYADSAGGEGLVGSPHCDTGRIPTRSPLGLASPMGRIRSKVGVV